MIKIKKYDEVKKRLEAFADFRERKHRGRYLSILALRSLDLYDEQKHTRVLTLEQLSDFGIKYDTYRHCWGDVTRECPHLRGTDYEDGERLAQEKQIDFGYSVGYHEDIKKLDTL